MEMMPRMAVLDKYDKYLTTIDNNKPESVHFYNENLTLYLQKSATTFEATFENKDDAEYLSVGNKLSFKYKDKDYQLIILKTIETENEITINAIGAGLGLVNNECESLESSTVLSLVDYIRRSDLEGVLKIGINQIPDRKLKLSLSSETLLQRIYSLESMFSCEIEIRTVLSDDYSLESFYIDIYKKDVGDQGIGNYRPEIKLEYGRNIESIEKTQDITEMITAVRPIGNNDLNLIGYQMEVRDSDNNILYISPENSGWIYSPRGRDLMPSNVTGKNSDDRYMKKTLNFSTDSQSELARLGLKELEQLSLPKVSYEVKGYFEGLNIGDTVRIYDKEFTPMLMLEARVSKVEICFTDKSNSKVTFSNFVELKSEIDPALIAKMQELAEQNKVYNAQILTDNTVVFKNNQGETTLIARVLDGIKDITDALTITWLKGDLEVGNGKNLRVAATDVDGVQLYRFNAFKDGKLIAQAQISVADVVDGTDGQPGADGADGENAINAYLTNENITLKADTQGNLKSGQLALASGQMVVVDGPTVVTSGVSYSIVSQTGCTATIDSVGNYRLTALTADSASVILRASYKGTALQKTFSVNKLYDALPGQNGTNGTNGRDGLNPITGYLTNESIIILANNGGSIDSQSLAQANGYFNIYNGQTKITNGVAYSIVSQTGVNVSLNATTGYYAVNSMSADFGTAIFKAVYNNVEIQKQLMVVKSYKSLGLVASSTAPSNPNVGQLWLNTSDGVTYRWTGTTWSIYLLSATNLNVTNLAALSANLGTVRTGKMQSNDNLVSFDLDNKQLYMQQNNGPYDEYYGGASNPGIKSRFWLTPSIFKYQYLEDPAQSGYYTSGYDSTGFYVNDRSQGVKLRSYGLDFGNNIVLSSSYVSTDYESVTLPYGLTGKLRRVGKVVTLTIPRQVINWTAPTGDYLSTSETIPFGFRPIDEVTVMINRFGGAVQLPIALHINSYGYTHLTSSGTGKMAFTGTCSWVTT